MEIQLQEILRSLDELAQRAKISRQRAFAAWFAINFCAIEEDDALEAAALDGGNDQGVDLIFADTNNEEVVIVQAHCPENFDKITPRSKWDALVAAKPFVDNPGQLVAQGRPDLAESITSIKSQYPEFKTSLGLITLGKHSHGLPHRLTRTCLYQVVANLTSIFLKKR